MHEMHGNIRLPGAVYIESCGVLVCRGEVRRIGPAMRQMVDMEPVGQQLADRATLRALHYEGCGLHAKEMVELCRRVMSRPGRDASLVYTHRGHRCQWKTPLLQSLLAMLGSGVRAHGLQVEPQHLPLDVVLFGVATLAGSEHCLIVKDNAIRVGAEEVVAASTTQYLVLSRASGLWAIKGIVMDEDASADQSTLAALSLDEFLAKSDRGLDSLSLRSRASNGCLGVMKLVRNA